MKKILKAAVITAMKAKEKTKLDAIRSVLSAIQYEEMQKKIDDLSDSDCIAILRNEIKKRKESLEFELKANRTEEADTLNKEIACLEEFLPQQLSTDKLKEILNDFKTKESPKNFGEVMKFLKTNFEGQYDGKVASDLAKEICG